MSTFYKFNHTEAMRLVGKKSSDLKIEAGQVWEKLSSDPVKKTSLVALHDSSGLIRRLHVSAATFNTLLQKSIPGKAPAAEIFSEDLNTLAFEGFATLAARQMATFQKALGSKSLSANYQEVVGTIKEFIRHLESASRDDLDYSKPDARLKAAHKFFSTSLALSLKETGHGSREGGFAYISGVEGSAKEWLERAIDWAHDQDLGMAASSLRDTLDLLKISRNLFEGQILKASSNSSLDTSVRESLPYNFWDKVGGADAYELQKVKLKTEQAMAKLPKFFKKMVMPGRKLKYWTGKKVNHPKKYKYTFKA